MRLPSKRQYPDYYVLIKHPIALEDIKNKLEAREYTSLEDVKHDFETCFRNAKRYNMKESQIFKDAKFLHVRSVDSLHSTTSLLESLTPHVVSRNWPPRRTVGSLGPRRWMVTGQTMKRRRRSLLSTAS